MTNGGTRSGGSGRLCIGRYEVLGEIAAGGMGRVLLAQLGGEGGFRRLVAIKLPHEHLKHDQAMVDRLLDEARIAAQVRHPHVVSIHEIDRSDAHGYFLVMDYVDGLSFSQVLARLGPPAPARWAMASRVALDALEGLAAAHETLDENGQPMNIVHRDISPQNILVGMDGIGRVTDFGIAKAASRLAMTRTGQTVGKLGYMSPEQLQGGLVEAPSDLFSLGVVLWESLVGRRLFVATQDMQALTRMLTEPIPTLAATLPGIPPGLSAVVEKALQRDPYMRFPDARAMAAALERATAEANVLARTQEVATWMRGAFAREIGARRQWIQNARPANESAPVDALPVVPGPVSTVDPAAGPSDTDVTNVNVQSGDEVTVQATPLSRRAESIDVPVLPAAPNNALRRNTTRPPAPAQANAFAPPPSPSQQQQQQQPQLLQQQPPSQPGLANAQPGLANAQLGPVPGYAPVVSPGGNPPYAPGAPGPGPARVPVLAVVVAMLAGVFCIAALTWYVTAR